LTSFRRRPSGKGDVILIGLALSTVIFLGAALKFRNHPVLVVATASTIEEATGSAATFPPVELTSTTDTAVLSGTATPGAVVRVREIQTVADVSGAWRITVDLIPGRNRFQALATNPSGLQVTTSFTVIYTRPVATTLVPTATTEAAPPPISSATTTVANDVPVTISSPLDGEVVTTHRITMSGTATPRALVNAGGTVVTASKNGLWEAVVTLKAGAHLVKVTATTPAGVTSSSITIVYEPPPPTSAEPTVPAETTAPTAPPPTTTSLPSDTAP
jgi:glucodextranase-like protein